MTDKRCTYDVCLDPEEIGCNRGFLLAECEYWQRREGNETSENDTRQGSSIPGELERNQSSSDKKDRLLRLPWTGNSLGLRDIELVTACRPATVVGVIGPFNSGKTTLLTLIYLLIQHGERLKSGIFAGSLSLGGWENLAASLRWTQSLGGPTFPPHTSRTAGRRPGMLHLVLNDLSKTRRDFLFTDPPGEWFSEWALKEDAKGAEGARWIQQHGDLLLFLVDREALSLPERGKARDALRDLARRVSPGLRGRSLAVVWTKSDVQVPSIIEQDLQNCFATEFPGHAEFRVRMRFGNEPRTDVEEPGLSLIDWIFTVEPLSTRTTLDIPVRDQSDLFLAYRGQP